MSCYGFWHARNVYIVHDADRFVRAMGAAEIQRMRGKGVLFLTPKGLVHSQREAALRSMDLVNEECMPQEWVPTD